ncbi:VOC family protein [Nocardia sp. 2]|uniref:VOC family protein n=1 Tax=Nocardia acididurans TaxID=2802282 RepID=A0ABS1LZ98_9NOCA|nr:VOC family protein [Nocardia acididurans]MBL1073743.1 VOC family protein [Nocardia acididurans]
MLNNIMFVTIYVTDQDRALEFYTEGLGLEKRIDFPGPEGRFLTVGVPNSSVQLILWHTAAADRPAGVDDQAVPGPVVLESDDLRKDFESLSRRGITFDRPAPEQYPFGLRIAAIDPDGNRIALRQPSRS